MKGNRYEEEIFVRRVEQIGQEGGRCPTLRNTQGSVGEDSEKLDLFEGVPG